MSHRWVAVAQIQDVFNQVHFCYIGYSVAPQTNQSTHANQYVSMEGSFAQALYLYINQ